MDGQGAFTEIVSAVFKEMGQPVKYQFYPWKRAESEAKAGNIFAAFPYIITAERQKDYLFSDPVLISTGKFFYMPERHPDGIAYTKLDDLLPYQIGGVLGYWYESPFKEARLKVDYATSDEQNIQKLYLGRVDLAATDELVGWQLIKHLYPNEVDKFATVQKPLNEDSLRLLISRTYPNSAELTQHFNAALKVIRDQGVIQKILEKYGVKQ
jgi:polar amino acid transport system substrate-binding protein